MSLRLLEIRNLRVLKQVSLRPSAGLNIIVGPNGSGKTSLLEAVCILCAGRTFRSGSAQQPLRSGTGSLTVFGHWRTEEGEDIGLGVERTASGRRVKLNGKRCKSIRPLVQLIPLQTVVPDSRYLFNHNARYRHSVLDWGLFHVEPSFYTLWLHYRQLLRQRNAALRSCSREADISLWEGDLASAGEALNKLRATHGEQWSKRIRHYAARLLQTEHIVVKVNKGWPENKSLLRILQDERAGDLKLGYTRYGAHRADIQVTIGGVPVREWASHGQQNLVILALQLAQIDLVQGVNGRRCVLLLDDLAGDLDRVRRACTLRAIDEAGAQTFMTTTDLESLDLPDWRQGEVFHVEHGRVQTPQHA